MHVAVKTQIAIAMLASRLLSPPGADTPTSPGSDDSVTCAPVDESAVGHARATEGAQTDDDVPRPATEGTAPGGDASSAPGSDGTEAPQQAPATSETSGVPDGAATTGAPLVHAASGSPEGSPQSAPTTSAAGSGPTSDAAATEDLASERFDFAKHKRSSPLNAEGSSWKPGKALLGAILFAAFDAYQLRLQQLAGGVVPVALPSTWKW